MVSAGAPAAEEACLKQHTCISLDGFTCTDTVSSLVDRVCYLEAKRYMAIKLRSGAYYQYCQIEPATVAALLSAPSIGRYYNQNIKHSASKGVYDCGKSSGKPATDDARGKETTRRAIDLVVIAAILVEQSRNAYYASNRRCACPDDTDIIGRRCGGRSAYSRLGGAEPYCSARDVPSELIERYRQRLSAQ